MADGYIYILSNPKMPGLVKIGFSERPVQERLAELSAATGVPVPFVLEAYFICPNPSALEKQIHGELQVHRIIGREFFEISVSEALRIMERICNASPAYLGPNRTRIPIYQPPSFASAPKTTRWGNSRRRKPIDQNVDKDEIRKKLEEWQRRRYED